MFNIITMETNEKTMTPEESLQIIKRSIMHSMHNLKEGSFYILLWGWIGIISSLFNYFFLRYLHGREMYGRMWIMSLVSWGTFIIAGFIIQFIHKLRTARKETVRTHLDRLFTILWLSVFVVFILMLLFCYIHDDYPTPYILAIAGMAIFISGMVVKFYPMIAGGIVIAGASVISVFVSGFTQLLVFAIAIFLGYIIPGYMLRRLK